MAMGKKLEAGMVPGMVRRVAVMVVATAAALLSSPVYGKPVSLSEAYQNAKAYDARLRAAHADNLMYREEVGKARSAFLPSVRASASRGRNATQHATMGYYFPFDYYNSVSYGTSIRQSVFSLPNIATFNQARLMADKSDTDVQVAESELMVRLAEAYCNALYADDNLAFSKVHISATKEQLQQARRRYSSGYGTVTEVNEAQASNDIAVAEGLDILNNVELRRHELETIIGVYPEALCRLAPEKIRLSRPVPGNVDAWVEKARTANLSTLSARQQIQIAGKEIQKQGAAGYPTIDLVAGKNYSDSDNNYSIGSIYDTYSVSLQLNMSIYSGGYIGASVRQARAKWTRAGEDLSFQERKNESEVRKYFQGVVNGIDQVSAYEQAVKSQEIALEGTKKGFAGGFRTNLDVLNAEQKLLDSRRNLAKARYSYILNYLMLRQSAGELSAADLDEVNSWLQ